MRKAAHQVQNINNLLEHLSFDRNSFAPHLDVKRKADEIWDELRILIDVAKKEDYSIEEIHTFERMIQDLSHTLNKEYGYCEYDFDLKRKKNSSQKIKNQYLEDVDTLVKRIRQDLSLLNV